MLNALRQVTRRVAARAAVATPPAVAPPAAGRWFVRDEAIMGTSIHVELWSEDADAAARALDAVIAEMHRIDDQMSPYRQDSALSRLNREAATRAVQVSDELFALLTRATEFSRSSDGAFDVTYAAAGHLYDYRRGIRPTAEQLAAAREAIGWHHLLLDPAARSVRFARAGVRVDLGGFAKGHAVERGAAILARHGIRYAVVAAGGDSRLLGDHCGRPWTIGVRDPRCESKVIALLPLQDCAISTSGDYERFFERDGERCHHLLDPRTGESPRGIRAVTAIAPDGLLAEALSKTVFVLGVEAGLRIVEDTPGADAVVVDAQGQLHFSSGLQAGGPVATQARTQ